MEKDTAPARATFSAAGIAAALLAGAWCGPAFGSSGIDFACDASERSLAKPPVPAISAPALAAHTESALAEILEEDAAEMPVLADAVSRSDIESIEEADGAQDETASGDDTPAVITRLPGVPEAVLPSFRRQMHRTDI